MNFWLISTMKIQCNVCEAAEAAVLCCADEAALCWTCDEKVHAANKLASKHQRVPLSTSNSQMPKCDICQVYFEFWYVSLWFWCVLFYLRILIECLNFDTYLFGFDVFRFRWGFWLSVRILIRIFLILMCFILVEDFDWWVFWVLCVLNWFLDD